MQYVEHPWLNRNVIEKRSYQDDVVKTAVSANTLCVLPTGLGKTSIAAIVAARRLERHPDQKVLFLAPTRPLVNQHKANFERFFTMDVEMKTVTGEDEPETRSSLYRKGDIIFSTPQTVRNDLKKGVLDLADFCLCIFDECHRCVGNYAYGYIASVYRNQSRNHLILGLTASPGSHRLKIEEIKKRMFIDNIEIKTRDDEDVKEYVQEASQIWVEVDLPQPLIAAKRYLENVKNARLKKLMDMRILNTYRTNKTQLIALQQELARRKTGAAWHAVSLIAEIIKVDHALVLLETQTLHSLELYLEEMKKGGTRAVARLLKESDFINACRLVAELVNEGKEHPKLEKLKEIVEEELSRNKETRVIVFAQYRSTIESICREIGKIKGAAPVEFIGQAKKKGKGLSQKEQTQILNEYKMGFYNILCASQVAEEGLDVVETDLVVFFEPVPSAIRKIQRAGRTARTRAGKVIVLIAKNTRDEAYHWSAHHKENKMKKILYDMKKSSDAPLERQSTQQKGVGDFASKEI